MDNKAKLSAGAGHTVMALAMVAKYRCSKVMGMFNLTAHLLHGSEWSGHHLFAPNIEF